MKSGSLEITFPDDQRKVVERARQDTRVPKAPAQRDRLLRRSARLSDVAPKPDDTRQPAECRDQAAYVPENPVKRDAFFQPDTVARGVSLKPSQLAGRSERKRPSDRGLSSTGPRERPFQPLASLAPVAAIDPELS